MQRPIGKNTLGLYPKKCAAILEKNIDSFTGHAFRRTSATIVADFGASMLALKRHGRWKSDRVAEGYVAESKKVKMEVANIISGEKEVQSIGETSSSANLVRETSTSANLLSNITPVKSSFCFGNLTLNNCVVSFNSS